VANGLASLAAPAWLDRWRSARTPRELRVIAALAVLVVAVTAWLALWQPLQRDLAALRATVPAERGALVQARKMADEMVALARATPARRTSDARADLERVLAERGLRGAVTQLDWQEDRARLVFADAGVEPLVSLLDTLYRDAQLRVVDATLTARVEPGTVRAELTLAR
jgi:type II secretory pathway component PulM